MYMRPKEKILSAIRGDPLDSPPALPLIGVHSALLAGVNPRKAFSCGKLMAELQILKLETQLLDYPDLMTIHSG